MPTQMTGMLGKMLRAGLDTGCPPNPARGYGCRLNDGFLVDLALLGSSIGLPAGRVAASTTRHEVSRLSANVWHRSFTLPSVVGRVSFNAAAAIAILTLVAACGQPPVTGAPRTNAVCTALQPAMPISYSRSKDTPDTVKQIRQANARYQAACQ